MKRRLHARLLIAVQALVLLFRGSGCAVVPVAGAHAAYAGTVEVAEPAQSRRSSVPLHAVPACEQARRLVRWLQGDVSGTTLVTSEPFSGEMLARDVQRQYREMAAELRWREYPWRLVGRELSLLLEGGRRTWAWIVDPVTGERHRLRVYRIPAQRTRAVTPPFAAPTPRLVSHTTERRLAA